VDQRGYWWQNIPCPCVQREAFFSTARLFRTTFCGPRDGLASPGLQAGRPGGAGEASVSGRGPARLARSSRRRSEECFESSWARETDSPIIYVIQTSAGEETWFHILLRIARISRGSSARVSKPANLFVMAHSPSTLGCQDLCGSPPALLSCGRFAAERHAAKMRLGVRCGVSSPHRAPDRPVPRRSGVGQARTRACGEVRPSTRACGEVRPSACAAWWHALHAA